MNQTYNSNIKVQAKKPHQPNQEDDEILTIITTKRLENNVLQTLTKLMNIMILKLCTNFVGKKISASDECKVFNSFEE